MKSTLKIFFTMFLFFSAMFFSGQSVFANTGFVESPMWFTPESPEEGDMVTVSAVFRNAEKYQISGTVLFYDNELLLGRKAVTISPGGIATPSVSFRIGAGEHSFSAQMSNLTETSGTGTTMPLALPLASAKLPKYFVEKDSKAALAAQAGKLEVTSNEKPLLDQIDNLQEKTLDAIPDDIKASVTAHTRAVEEWRSGEAKYFENKKTDASVRVEAVEKKKAEEKKKDGAPSASTKFIDTPFAYLKLWIFSALAFLFATPVMFYIVGILLVFFVLRFIFHKIARAWKKRRNRTKGAGKVKAPEI